MKAGIGYSNRQDSFSSGRSVAEDALRKGKIDRPGIVLAFCGGRLDHEEFFKGLQSVVGKATPIIGGSAIGIITNENLSYEGFPAGAAVLDSEGIQYVIAAEGGLDRNEREAGNRLAEKLTSGPDDRVLLLFYDSVKRPPTETTPPIMNASPPLIKGLEEKLKSKVPIIGAGVIGDFNFAPTKQFCGTRVSTQSVVGALIKGDCSPYARIMHGCTPKDGIYHTVTKIDGPVIYELDGKPIVEIIDDFYGNQDWQNQLPVNRLTIGINHGKKFGHFQEENYVNRLIAGILPDRQGIVIFEPDLEEGTEVLFMLRDVEKMIESVRKNTGELMEQIGADGRRPALGLYIDCAGRTAGFSHTRTEEAEEVQKVFNRHKTPLLGFYSGVEVAPLLGKSRGLDWTGVLMVLAQ